MGCFDKTFMCVTTPSYLFIIFESSFKFLLPFSFVVLLLFVLYMSKFVKLLEVKSILNEVLFHFYSKFYPGVYLMVTLFLLIMIMNVFSLVPGVFSMSSLPLMTLSMGLVMWGGGYIYSIYYNYSSCVSHFLPQSSPMLLSLFLVWIEIISLLCRPLALSVRLMANITAGHLLMFLCSSSVFYSSLYFMLPFIFLLALVVLEVGVSFIQSYVYQLLLSLYMQESLD